MDDKELLKLIMRGISIQAKISEKKLKGAVKNVIQEDLEQNAVGKQYVKVAEELAKRLIAKGYNNLERIPFEKLSKIEQAALIMVRNDSCRDIEHLKGDYVISSFIQQEIIKQKYSSKPPLKRMQLTDKQLKSIFLNVIEKKSIRQISKEMGINRKTIMKVLKSDYQNPNDLKRIENARKDSNIQTDG